MNTVLFICYRCQYKLAENEFGRQDTCPGCRSATRCCSNCINYDRSKYNECKEPVADRVVDKEKSTFCDHFKPSNNLKTNSEDAKKAALSAAEALFKKS